MSLAPFVGRRRRHARRRPYPALPVHAEFLIRTENVLYSTDLARTYFSLPARQAMAPINPFTSPIGVGAIAANTASVGLPVDQFTTSSEIDIFPRYTRFPYNLEFIRYCLSTAAFPYADLQRAYGANLNARPPGPGGFPSEFPGLLNTHQYVRWKGTSVEWKQFDAVVRNSISARVTPGSEESTFYLGGATGTPIPRPQLKPRVYYIASRAIAGLATLGGGMQTMDTRAMVTLLESACRSGVARRMSFRHGRVFLRPLVHDVYSTVMRNFPPNSNLGEETDRELFWSRASSRYPGPIPTTWITDGLTGSGSYAVPDPDPDAYRRSLIFMPFTEGYLFFFYPQHLSANRFFIGGAGEQFTTFFAQITAPDLAVRVTWTHHFELSVPASFNESSALFVRSAPIDDSTPFTVRGYGGHFWPSPIGGAVGTTVSRTVAA